MSPPTALGSGGFAFKGPSAAPDSFPTAPSLRIGIVHARWNAKCIQPLVSGAISSLTKAGVKLENIVVESVPGSWELPMGTARLISAGQTEAAQAGGDLMTGATALLDDASLEGESSGGGEGKVKSAKGLGKPFDAVISIGTLIKGSTMHFEYISESCCHGLMRVGLDTNTPVILGVLTCLSEEQALQRSGVGEGAHNHGEDWGNAAVE